MNEKELIFIKARNFIWNSITVTIDQIHLICAYKLNCMTCALLFKKSVVIFM